MSSAQTSLTLRAGMVALVRKRRALVKSVQEFQTQSGQVSRLVGVEYLDADGSREDQLLREREPINEVIEPRSLPNVEAAPPMPLRAPSACWLGQGLSPTGFKSRYSQSWVLFPSAELM